MQRKMIVSVIIIALLFIMIYDFKINKERVFEDYLDQMMTDSIRNIEDNYYGDIESIKEKAKASSTVQINTADVTRLEINNKLGSIIITGEERDDIEVDYEIIVVADKKSQAEEFIRNVEIKKRIDKQVLEIYQEKRVEIIPNYIRAVRVDYKIKAPEELALKLKNSYGQLNVKNFTKDVDLENYCDKLTVVNIGGKADVLIRNGDLNVDGINGDTKIKTAYSNSKVSNIKGSFYVNSNGSNVEIENIAGMVEAVCNYGALNFNDLQKDLIVNAKNSVVRGSDLEGKLEADMRYGDLNLSNIKNDIKITANYSNLHLHLGKQLTDYNVYCEIDYGDLATNLPFKIKEDKSKMKLEGEVGSGEVEIEVKSRYGQINLY